MLFVQMTKIKNIRKNTYSSLALQNIFVLQSVEYLRENMGFDWVSYTYSLVVASGGIMGYLKAGSTASLGAGLIFGGLSALGAYRTSADPQDLYLTLGVTSSLGMMMGYRFYNSGKFMPAGLVALLRLKERTGVKDLNRFDYLQALVTEFQETTNEDDKEQVLANLANFGYDPINYGYLRQLQVIELFVDCIAEDEDLNGKIVEFGISGLCNVLADPENRDSALALDDFLTNVKRCLSSTNSETVLSGITTIILSITPQNKHEIIDSSLVQHMQELNQSNNKRIRTLAELFLQDYM